MTLAGEYAYAGRDWVCERVARLLGAAVVERSTTTTISRGGKSTMATLLGGPQRGDSGISRSEGICWRDHGGTCCHP